MTHQRIVTTLATAAGTTSQEPETEGPSSLDTSTMAIFHEATIHLLLNIERFALEAIGHESDLDFEHDMSAPLASSNRSSTTSDQEPVESQEPARRMTILDMESRANRPSSSMPPYTTLRNTTTLFFPKNKWLRYCCALAVFVTTVLLLSGYYMFHLVAFDEDKAFIIAWYLEWILLPLGLSLPFSAPLHRALGYQDGRLSRSVCDRRLEILSQDQGTKILINYFLICLVFYTFGDCYFFYINVPGNKPLFPLYIIATVLNIGVIYGAMLLATITARAILTRLFSIEHEVDAALESVTTAMAYYGSNSSSNNAADHDRVVLLVSSTVDGSAQSRSSWLQAYQSIRHDMHGISESYGTRMLFVLLLFVIETSATIGSVWESIGESFDKVEVALMMTIFVANSSLLVVTFFSYAYIVTQCVHHIGPKLSMLAAARSGENQNQNLFMLAHTFLLAPIRLHVGNFEVSPEYANAMSFWFLGLFLVVFGLHMPGVE
jgi:hypothetical protein